MTCATCSHHSVTEREKVLGVADEDMEIVEFSEDEVERVYLCQHPDQRGRSMGAGERAGEGCKLYSLGSKRGVDPELERRLAWRSNRTSDKDRER